MGRRVGGGAEDGRLTAFAIPDELRSFVESNAPALSDAKRPCPLADGHGIQPGCIVCAGTGQIDDWREVDACALAHFNANRAAEQRWTVSQARALLAYRDETASQVQPDGVFWTARVERLYRDRATKELVAVDNGTIIEIHSDRIRVAWDIGAGQIRRTHLARNAQQKRWRLIDCAWNRTIIRIGAPCGRDKESNRS